MQKKIFLTASILGFFAVFMGAFGAHALNLEDNAKGIYKIASSYHFYSVFLIFLIGLLESFLKFKYYKIAFFCSFIGVIIFSGSLYLLSVTNIKWLGAITPIGGLLLAFSFIALYLGFKLKS
tara:strand:- start:259 stop:624 length:366 start_codon:yes stop_codon:yes gene_type:complete